MSEQSALPGASGTPLPAPTATPTKEEEMPEPLSFTLQVITSNPSGTGTPNHNPQVLSFTHLPASTTVQELRAKIRDVLSSRPADNMQRLIYRGRMLGREADTMLDIFGLEAVHYP